MNIFWVKKSGPKLYIESCHHLRLSFSFVWEKVAKWDLFLIGKKPIFCHVTYEWINGPLRDLTWAHKVIGLLLRPKINSNNWNFPYEENIYFLIGNMKKIFQWDKDLFSLNPLIFPSFFYYFFYFYFKKKNLFLFRCKTCDI